MCRESLASAIGAVGGSVGVGRIDGPELMGRAVSLSFERRLRGLAVPRSLSWRLDGFLLGRALDRPELDT